ncbi:MAG: twitching motility protein PilT [Deltaproteobacteria bacterium]|nr:twitching motility protein PilT [Deltaproteobacteria bacterium]
MKINVSIRFYEELNDFLAPEKQKREFTASAKDSFNVQQLIESLGVPESEVDLILVNGRPVPFSHLLQDQDRISVYPVFETFDISAVSRLRERPLRTPRFLLDVGLDNLLNYLKILGFDAAEAAHDEAREIITQARAEHRIILTRDEGLVKSKEIDRCYLVKNDTPLEQLKEIIKYFNLFSLIS